MTQQQLYEMLEATGLPVAYSHNEDYQEPPFIAYLFDASDDLIADNYNYLIRSYFNIELYTRTKDLVTEALLEDKLKENEIPYYKSEVWLEDEKVFRILYEIKT